MRRRPLPPSMPALSRRRLVGRALAVAATAPLLPRLARAQEKKVNVYNWDTYIGENTLDDFTEATGIDVRYDLFASNDELFAKLREGNPGYDVIFPSNNYVERMIVANMVRAARSRERSRTSPTSTPRFADPAFDPGLRTACPISGAPWASATASRRRTPTKWARHRSRPTSTRAASRCSTTPTSSAWR